MLLLLVWPSYSFSEIVFGQTGNAAQNGLRWVMTEILPAQAGLTVDNVIYRYTMVKERETDVIVSVRNEDKIDGGYVFEEVDDWSGFPGATISKVVPLPVPALIDRIGDGEINVEGPGQVVNPTVRYTFRFDPCFDPQSDPECPGFKADMLDFLLNSGILDPEEVKDPYDSDEVQKVLDEKADTDEDDKYKDERVDNEEDDTRRKLAGDNALMAEAAALAAQFDALAMLPKFEQYYEVKLDGKTYDDVVQLRDSTLPDNRRAFGSLASDGKFDTIIESQYNR